MWLNFKKIVSLEGCKFLLKFCPSLRCGVSALYPNDTWTALVNSCLTLLTFYRWCDVRHQRGLYSPASDV